jgi:sigma-B regulation protein RsbU (phosphoserine phosphatase)
LRRVLSRTRRERGEIPFAVDGEGNLYTPDPADLSHLEGLQLTERAAQAGSSTVEQPDPDWVTVFKEDPASDLTFGIARPVGDSLDQMRNTAATNLGIGLALVGLALGGILPLSGRMTRNLERLTRGAERLAGGDLEARVEKRSRDEFGQLAQTFNRMARQLGEHQRRLVEQERLRKELEISRRIQADLLPQGTYRSPQAHVRGISIPAKELGGDFFNYFPLDGDRLGILVGDVSGKGVGAALLMANIQATLQARLPVARDLAQLTDALDQEIANSTPDEVYLTLFLGILDPQRQELRYVNAGHTPPLAVRQDGSVDRLVSAGRPPGLLPGGGYREQRVPMAPGDSLFLYTDGLIEAEDHEGEPFGVERLQVLLLKEKSLDLEALLERVESALREFSGSDDAADDATLVALKVPSPIPASAGA